MTENKGNIIPVAVKHFPGDVGIGLSNEQSIFAMGVCLGSNSKNENPINALNSRKIVNPRFAKLGDGMTAGENDAAI